jgi:hypothetical protein
VIRGSGATRGYNPRSMGIRDFLFGVLLLGTATAAGAQAFGSVSSAPTPAVPPAAAIAPPQALVAPAVAPPQVVAPQPALAPPAPAGFSSVSAPLATTYAASSGGTAGGAGAGPRLPAADAGGAPFEMADRILVEKDARRLSLLRGGRVVAEYPIRLGLNPYGHKLREGDFRTPEGTYHLSRRNPRSEFFLSLEVSYPSAADRARARRAGDRPGGLIMIHGQPNVPRKSPDYYANNDWTDGCIAVSNSDMVDIWLRTGIGTTIEIRP